MTPDTEGAASLVRRALADQLSYVNAAPDVPIEAIATGAVLGEMEANAAEFAANGWKQVGTPTVATVQVIETDLDADPPRVRFSVCLDSSDVQVYDQSGAPLRGEGTKPRSLNLYTMTQIDGAWKLADHSFPDQADC